MKNFAKKSVAIMLASILITAGISGCVGFNAVYYESSQLIAQEQIGQVYNEAINLQTLNEDNDAFYYASHSVNNAPTQISPEFAEQPNLYTYESKISAARIEFEPKPTPLPEPILTPTPRIATNTSITGEWHHINEERDFRFRIEFIRPNTVIYYAGWYYQWAARADGQFMREGNGVLYLDMIAIDFTAEYDEEYKRILTGRFLYSIEGDQLVLTNYSGNHLSWAFPVGVPMIFFRG